MKIDNQLIDYVAALSRLEVADSEREGLIKDLGSIIGYMDKLNTLNTDDIEPMSHAFPVLNVFRED